ncbi:hypothetical protein BA895_06065 [Humibacillus sp. DSM 29435]|nr:hypothetical protein BA895_06065 [Humibacillus sp. DSM 29435]
MPWPQPPSKVGRVHQEHLLVLPDRDAADDVADELMRDGFTEVRVLREALAGEDDADDHEWAVHVITRDDDTLADRFRETAAAHGGWYDPDPSGSR